MLILSRFSFLPHKGILRTYRNDDECEHVTFIRAPFLCRTDGTTCAVLCTAGILLQCITAGPIGSRWVACRVRSDRYRTQTTRVHTTQLYSQYKLRNEYVRCSGSLHMRGDVLPRQQCSRTGGACGGSIVLSRGVVGE